MMEDDRLTIAGSYTIGTAMHRMMEAALEFDRRSGKLRALEDALKKIPAGSPVFDGSRLVGYVMDEVSGPVEDVTIYYGGRVHHGSWKGLVSIDPPPPKPDPPRGLRNDGRRKAKKQDEPFYVSKTKRKRR